MEKIEAFLRNKNKMLNTAIILVSLFIALQIFKTMNNRKDILIGQKENELKKNKTIEDITSFEKTMGTYKKALVKLELGPIMDTMSSLAKGSSVNIVSIKPGNEEIHADYGKFSFSITAIAPDYHALGDFISRLENYSDIYFVDEVNISSQISGSAEGGSAGLSVILNLSTIYYL